MTEVLYLGHSAFSISTAKGTVLIDPFLDGNPCASMNKDCPRADAILVTHAHGDHLGDAVSISKRTGAPIIGTYELAQYCAGLGARTIDAHFGGVVDVRMGKVKLFPAMHSSSAEDGTYLGQAASFVLCTEGQSIYHAGDTALFGDMSLIGEEFDLDLALLPIGGHYTMGIDDAVRAVKRLRPRKVVPMHYGTFPMIEADPLVFKTKVERDTAAKCFPLRPGEALQLTWEKGK